MVNKNVEGPKGPVLTDAKKYVCTVCNSTTFQLADQVDVAGAGEKIYLLCHNGHEIGRLVSAWGALDNYSD